MNKLAGLNLVKQPYINKLQKYLPAKSHEKTWDLAGGDCA